MVSFIWVHLAYDRDGMGQISTVIIALIAGVPTKYC